MNGTLEALRAELAPIKQNIAAIQSDIATIRADLAIIRPMADGMPLVHRKLETIQQDQRMLKVAVNELARLQFTSGEVDALHADVNAVMAKNTELEHSIATLQRELRELKEQKK